MSGQAERIWLPEKAADEPKVSGKVLELGDVQEKARDAELLRSETFSPEDAAGKPLEMEDILGETSAGRIGLSGGTAEQAAPEKDSSPAGARCEAIVERDAKASGGLKAIEEAETILLSEQVTVDFDGFKAVNEMNFELKRGELRFLIGPNGAGKTTMLDCLCGKVRPTKGRILFRGKVDLTNRSEYQIARLGIGRKFQAPSVFFDLTVEENLELAMHRRKGVFDLLRLRKQDRERLDEQLEMTRLQDKRRIRAGALSHGEKQWLEIGMILMLEPDVVLLDEPVAGMSDEETFLTGELLRRIAKNRSVVVVEHDMEFVRRFASKVTVMHEGRLLKEGTMEEVQNDKRVVEVYLGGREHHVESSTA